jgi:hypothetical protein
MYRVESLLHVHRSAQPWTHAVHILIHLDSITFGVLVPIMLRSKQRLVFGLCGGSADKAVPSRRPLPRQPCH